MKIACFADVHANLFEEFAEKDAKYGNTRLKDIIHCLHRIHKYCISHDIDTLLFAGDLFHKRVLVNTLVENLVYDEIKSMVDDELYIYMIPGNHDQVDNSDYPQHSLHIFDSLDNVYIADKGDHLKPIAFPDNGNPVYIYPTPYSKNVDMIKSLISDHAEFARQHDSKEVCHILLGHMGIDGASTGKSSYPLEGAFKLGDLYPDVFDFGIFGHYHKRQHLGGIKNYFYIGAPIQHNFNDEGQKKGFAVIDTEEKKVKFINLKSPKFITVDNPELVDDPDFLNELSGNYVRFQIPATKVEKVNQNIDELNSEVKYRVEPQKEYKEEKRLDINHSMSNEEVIKKYCDQFNPDAEQTLIDIIEEVS